MSYVKYDPQVTIDRLGRAMYESGLTARGLAESIGVRTSTVRNYLCGHTSIPAKRLFYISLELGVTVDYLLGLTNTNNI